MAKRTFNLDDFDDVRPGDITDEDLFPEQTLEENLVNVEHSETDLDDEMMQYMITDHDEVTHESIEALESASNIEDVSNDVDFEDEESDDDGTIFNDETDHSGDEDEYVNDLENDEDVDIDDGMMMFDDDVTEEDDDYAEDDDETDLSESEKAFNQTIEYETNDERLTYEEMDDVLDTVSENIKKLTPDELDDIVESVSNKEEKYPVGFDLNTLDNEGNIPYQRKPEPTEDEIVFDTQEILKEKKEKESQDVESDIVDEGKKKYYPPKEYNWPEWPERPDFTKMDQRELEAYQSFVFHEYSVHLELDPETAAWNDKMGQQPIKPPTETMSLDETEQLIADYNTFWDENINPDDPGVARIPGTEYGFLIDENVYDGDVILTNNRCEAQLKYYEYLVNRILNERPDIDPILCEQILSNIEHVRSKGRFLYDQHELIQKLYNEGYEKCDPETLERIMNARVKRVPVAGEPGAIQEYADVAYYDSVFFKGENPILDMYKKLGFTEQQVNDMIGYDQFYRDCGGAKKVFYEKHYDDYDIQREQELYPENIEEHKKFVRKDFKNRVISAEDKYKLEDVLHYLEGYKTSEFKDKLQDLYTEEYAKYVDFVDLTQDVYNDALWLIAIDRFIQFIEHGIAYGMITEVFPRKRLEDIPDPPDVTIINDSNLEEIKQKNKKQKELLSKTALDPVVYEIAEDEFAMVSSIFDDTRELYREYTEGPFSKIINRVMSPDKTATEDWGKLQCKVIINAQTAFLPVIDFNTGVRLICIDTDDSDQFRINPYLLHRNVKFSYPNQNMRIRVRPLYLDNCRNKPNATIASLKKLVGYPYIQSKYKIVLDQNYVIAYTTDIKQVELFENGDIDSKSPENSTYYAPKPSNACIGVIIVDKKTERDIRAMRREQIRNHSNQNVIAPVDVENYDIHFVLSARYIRNDLRLRNASIPKEERYVEYIITQYNEANPVMIFDGLQTIIACIIKEHWEKYSDKTPYLVRIEFDRDNLTTPALVNVFETGDGVEMSPYNRTRPMDVQTTYTYPPSRLKMEGVRPFERGRLDYRYFTTASIQSRYPHELWSQFNLDTKQGKFEFLKSRGFEEFLSPTYMTFDVMRIPLMNIENSRMIQDIHRININALYDRNSDDTEYLLYKQRELEYFRQMDNDQQGGIGRMLYSILDYLANNLFSN